LNSIIRPHQPLLIYTEYRVISRSGTLRLKIKTNTWLPTIDVRLQLSIVDIGSKLATIFRLSATIAESLLISEWQESYPKDNFDFLPSSSTEDPHLDEKNLSHNQCVEQDDEDEVFSQLLSSTNFFFCHQSELQRHLLYR
jgi:hypothetical protein